MKIGEVEIENGLFLAPMAGVTDIGFRFLARKFGAGLSYTEMVSAQALVYAFEKKDFNNSTLKYLLTTPIEKPCAVQLFGHDPDVMAKACCLPFLDKFDIIDINMGCPAPKIVKNGDGSALLKNPDLAVLIAEKCVKATTKPITVKLRLGWDDDSVFLDLSKRLEKVGVKAITLHARTREQMYGGQADLNSIKKLKKHLKIPVVGNGDVFDEKSYVAMKQTGCDAVMVGRGCLGKPWFFDLLLGNNAEFSLQEIIKQHIDLLKTCYKEKYVCAYFRKHLLWYFSRENLRRINLETEKINALRLQACKIEKYQDIDNILNEIN